MTRPAVWAEVDLDRIRRNTQRLKALLEPETLLLAVVKAGGYGHGGTQSAKAAIAGGADWLAVARVEEGEELRAAGIEHPVLLLSQPPTGSAERIIRANLVPTIYSVSSAEELSLAGIRLPVHIKVDTGMHRYGVLPEELLATFDEINALPNIEIQGIWSHLAVSEEIHNSFTKQQYERFLDALEELGPRADGLIKHLANSAGILTLPDGHFDMVRAGIAIYGIHPSLELAERIELEPAMSLKSEVALVKRVGAGESISYGQHYSTKSETTIVTVPAGYADGVRRGLSDGGEVLIRGRRHPIAGSITMDHLMADAGDAEVSVGDEVVILGRQGGEEITAHEIAAHLGTIPYEVVCGIDHRVPRVYR